MKKVTVYNRTAETTEELKTITEYIKQQNGKIIGMIGLKDGQGVSVTFELPGE
ncbi:hypothetical protein [Jeotgalibacillus aurantiacus]|uniref:hypothetical protein n=1 Tax=Jeotgalibacillus aurantiacus TaxID=2763266 RepID=UPI001D0ADA63|nr:hypothetical protein [Jeotgalibacillus aurantiacus]